MRLGGIETALDGHGLTIFGAFHPGPDDLAPEAVRTLVLLGPKEPGFWALFTCSAEYLDPAPDPLDRWSERVIGDLARDLRAQALFPFGGPPFQPFIKWAHRTGRAHQSPVGLLVHDEAGLMISYRGALGFDSVLDVPEPAPSPCLTCTEKPCLTACPVDAFGRGVYDVAGCKADLERPGNDCLSRGCLVRRVCPASRAYGREEAQSAFHMRAFK